jgi:predicted PurR-regulated permease PerM
MLMTDLREADDARRTVRRTVIVIGLVLATAVGLYLVYEARQVLVWILVAAFFAVALNPVVDWVQLRMPRCKRTLATLAVFLVVFALLGGLIAMFVVPLAREGGRFLDELPNLGEEIQNGRGPLGRLADRYNVLEYVRSHSGELRGYVPGLGGGTVAILRGAVTTIAGIITIFVLAYLIVLQAPKISSGTLGQLDARRADRLRRVGRACARTITGYISGNLLISVIAATLTYLTLTLLNVPFAALIALFVGITDLIPLVGATLGAVVATIVGFTQSVTAGIILIIFFIAYQQVENHLLQPLVFSRTVRLNPLTVLVAIVIAAELAGIVGALLAIPVAGMIQIILGDVWRERRARRDRGHSPPTPGARDIGPATSIDSPAPTS